MIHEVNSSVPWRALRIIPLLLACVCFPHSSFSFSLASSIYYGSSFVIQLINLIPRCLLFYSTVDMSPNQMMHSSSWSQLSLEFVLSCFWLPPQFRLPSSICLLVGMFTTVIMIMLFLFPLFFHCLFKRSLTSLSLIIINLSSSHL